MEIDLHGINYIEAEALVISIIEKFLNSNTIITVITGNSKKMKDVVINILDEYGIKPYPKLDEAIIKFIV